MSGKYYWIIATVTTDGEFSEVGSYDGGPFYPLRYANYWVASSMCVGPDGAVWATSSPPGYVEVEIVRAGLEGTITAFPTGVGLSVDRNLPVPICAGPDGNIWFSAPGATGGTICKMTLDGTVTQYTIPGMSSVSATSMCAGPDGNVWFALGQYVGNVTPDGTITTYALPDLPLPDDDETFVPPLAVGICLGPDGNLWASNNSIYDSIISGLVYFGYAWRISPSGDLGYLYTGPTSVGGSDTPPEPLGQIISGPDGQLWMSMLYWGSGVGTYSLVSFTTSGDVTTPATTGLNQTSNAIAQGPDGDLWVPGGVVLGGAYGASSIFKSTPAGDVTEYPLPTNWSCPVAICAPADGKLWFVCLQYVPGLLQPLRMLQRSDGFGLRMRQLDGSGNAPSSLRSPAIGNAHV